MDKWGVEMPKINQEEYEVLKALDSRAKSIVRQDRGWLWVAEQPMMKDRTGWYVADGFDEVLKDDNLFQFIQWEDEKPYEISELIREYEIKELRLAPSGTVEDDKLYVGEYVKHKINQLDEPEVLSQELPVIPKYVADWVIRYRDTYDLYPALRTLEYNTSTWEQVYKWYRENTHKFVNAYLTGEYEVEEEPLYHALIKGHDVSGDSYVYWNCDKFNNDVIVSRLHPPHDDFSTELSKSEWNELGINDSNADFVKVEEME